MQRAPRRQERRIPVPVPEEYPYRSQSHCHIVHRPAPSRKFLAGEEDTLRVILSPRSGRPCPLYPVEREPDYYRVEYAALLGATYGNRGWRVATARLRGLVHFTRQTLK